MGISIVTQHRNITPEQVNVHKSTIRALFEILRNDPARVTYLSTSDDNMLEALGVPRLVSSSDKETQELGANVSMLLIHHVEGLTMHDLMKFDQAAKDYIQKQESLKVWQTIN